RREAGEEVLRLGEVQARLLADLRGGERTELGVGVQPGPDGGAADGQLAGAQVRVADGVEGEDDLGDPAADDLAEGDRGGVLQVGAPDHDRSEEHTSQLQSRFDLVCRLLLEKKKIQWFTT